MKEVFKNGVAVLAFALLMSAFARTARGSDVPLPPPTAAMVAAHERRIDRIEAVLGLTKPRPVVRAAAAPEVVASSVTVTTATARKSYVSGRGHTHTCPFDGTTWDHGAWPSHACPECGRQQLVQDAHAVRGSSVHATLTTRLTATSGCPNGQCNYGNSQSQRRGFFRR